MKYWTCRLRNQGNGIISCVFFTSLEVILIPYLLWSSQKAENLICVTENKPERNLIDGFAQNIKQLESSFQTNMRNESGMMAMILITSMVLSLQLGTGTSCSTLQG